MDPDPYDTPLHPSVRERIIFEERTRAHLQALHPDLTAQPSGARDDSPLVTVLSTAFMAVAYLGGLLVMFGLPYLLFRGCF